ncbi:hypothetical protein U1Q18_037403 [Sarracenia purpurea var. burkii]
MTMKLKEGGTVKFNEGDDNLEITTTFNGDDGGTKGALMAITQKDNLMVVTTQVKVDGNNSGGFSNSRISLLVSQF